jgi:hypothetical protein
MQVNVAAECAQYCTLPVKAEDYAGQLGACHYYTKSYLGLQNCSGSQLATPVIVLVGFVSSSDFSFPIETMRCFLLGVLLMHNPSFSN